MIDAVMAGGTVITGITKVVFVFKRYFAGVSGIEIYGLHEIRM